MIHFIDVQYLGGDSGGSTLYGAFDIKVLLACEFKFATMSDILHRHKHCITQKEQIDHKLQTAKFELTHIFLRFKWNGRAELIKSCSSFQDQ